MEYRNFYFIFLENKIKIINVAASSPPFLKGDTGGF